MNFNNDINSDIYLGFNSTKNRKTKFFKYSILYNIKTEWEHNYFGMLLQ